MQRNVREYKSITMCDNENYPITLHLQTCIALILIATNNGTFVSHFMAGAELQTQRGITSNLEKFTRNNSIAEAYVLGGDETAPSVFTRKLILQILAANDKTCNLQQKIIITNPTSKTQKCCSVISSKADQIAIFFLVLPVVIVTIRSLKQRDISLFELSIALSIGVILAGFWSFLDAKIDAINKSLGATTILKVSKNNSGIFATYNTVTNEGISYPEKTIKLH